MKTFTYYEYSKVLALMIVVLILNPKAMLSSASGLHTLETRRVKYCGSRLADALRFVCDGNYYDGTNKRAMEELQGIAFDDLNRYSMNKRSLKSLSRPWVSTLRVSRQANMECCQFGCGYSDLKAYCGSNSL